MSPYKPTTEDMKEQFVAGAMITGFAYSRDEARADFDRWLRDQLAEAWEEGAATGLDKGLDIAELVHQGSGKLNIPDVPPPPTNPYRTQDGE